jgi:hypothetical protein
VKTSEQKRLERLEASKARAKDFVALKQSFVEAVPLNFLILSLKKISCIFSTFIFVNFLRFREQGRI